MTTKMERNPRKIRCGYCGSREFRKYVLTAGTVGVTSYGSEGGYAVEGDDSTDMDWDAVYTTGYECAWCGKAIEGETRRDLDEAMGPRYKLVELGENE